MSKRQEGCRQLLSIVKDLTVNPQDDSSPPFYGPLLLLFLDGRDLGKIQEFSPHDAD